MTPPRDGSHDEGESKSGVGAFDSDSCAEEHASNAQASDDADEAGCTTPLSTPPAGPWCKDELRRDRAVVLAAVAQNGRALEHASGELGTKRTWCWLRWPRTARRCCTCRRGFRRTWTWCSPRWLRDGPARRLEELRNAKDVVLAAVVQHGRTLYHASKRLQNDKDVVLAAVAKNGYALRYASVGLRNDRDVALAAVAHPDAPGIVNAPTGRRHGGRRRTRRRGGRLKPSPQGPAASTRSTRRTRRTKTTMETAEAVAAHVTSTSTASKAERSAANASAL